MLQGKPLNNFVTLQGTIRIIIDGKIFSADKGDLMEWRHKDRLKVTINPDTAKVKDSFELGPTKSKEITLALKARDEGMTKENEPYLHLFYYYYDRPIDKEVREQVLKQRLSVLDMIKE